MTDKSSNSKVLIVAGPTASGKSQVSINLACTLHGEIINLDSVQLYKDLNIGAAKLSEAEMCGIPHHLFSICDPRHGFDVAKYIREANKKIIEVQERAKLPILVGGTSLYITTLLHGLVDLPPSEETLRKELEERATEDLYSELMARDEVSAKSLHANDRNRIVRALEAAILYSAEIASVKKDHSYSDTIHQAIIVVPMWPRSELYKRIDLRSSEMVKNGLVEEVKMLIAKYGEDSPALKSIGYHEVLSFLKFGGSEEKLVDTISQHTRRFAKRQMTWLRNEPLKRNWEVSPKDDSEDGILLEGDLKSYVNAKRLRHFRVLALNFKELAEKVKNELDHGSSSTKVWFLDAKKL